MSEWKVGAMRLFIAAELPYELVEALSETSALLRTHVKGRYVGTDSFHVTLAFLGSVPAQRVDAAAEALDRGCQGHGALEVSLGELGSFGKRSAATLWQGLRPEDELRALAVDVRAALKDAEFEFDEKPFRAHITLMRKADLTRGELPPAAIASGRIEAITLFSSDLSGDRPRYEPLHTVVLR